MSDELLDGRGLRNRKPLHDHEADAAENDDKAPLPAASQAEDQPSGPYVVLEPPVEAAQPPAAEEPTTPPPAQVTSLRDRPKADFVPKFDPTTANLPPVAPEDTQPAEPEPQTDSGSISRRQLSTMEFAYTPEEHPLTPVPPPVDKSTMEMQITPDPEPEPPAEPSEPAPKLQRRTLNFKSDAWKGGSPLPPDEKKPPEPQKPSREEMWTAEMRIDLDSLEDVESTEDQPAADPPRTPDTLSEAADKFMPHFHTPTEKQPPVPEKPAHPDQIMRLPKIKADEDDNGDERPVPPKVRTAPEPTRISEPTDALPRPDDFVPHFHTPTGPVNPVDEFIDPDIIDDEDVDDEGDGYVADEFDEGPKTVDKFHTAHLSPVDEIVTGEFIAAEDIPAADWVLEVGEKFQGEKPRYDNMPPEQHTSALYQAVKTHGWKFLLTTAALILLVGAVIFVPAALNSNQPPADNPTPTAPLVTQTIGLTLPVGGDLLGDTPTPSSTDDATPLPPFAQGRIVFASDRDGDFDIYVRVMATGEETMLTDNTAADRTPAWSPDGAQIVFVSDAQGTDDLYVMNADGSNLNVITSGEAMDHQPTWSPDGQYILFSREDINGASLLRLPATCIEQGAAACEAAQVSLTADRYDIFPAWSPDGRRIAFAASDIPGQPLSIALIESAGTGFVTLSGTGDSNFSPVWSPDGNRIAFVSVTTGSDDIWVMAADGTSTLQVTADAALDAAPTWSPDGLYLVFASDRGPAGDFDLYLIPVACLTTTTGCDAEARTLTTSPGNDLDPAWIP